MTEESLTVWGRRLAPALILLATFVGYMAGRGYPLLRPEVALILFGLAAMGAVIGWLCEFLPRWAVALLLGLLFILFANVAFSESDTLANVLAGYFDGVRGKLLSRVIGITVVFVLPLAIALILRRSLPVIMVAATCVFIVGALARPAAPPPVAHWNPQSTAGKPGRLVLHLILDEFVGNAGLDSGFPDAVRLRGDVAGFFLSRGFVLHQNTFSSYRETRNSIPALMNFSRPAPDNRRPVNGPTPFAWFRTLHGNGYRIDYIGIDTLPLCAGPNAAMVSNCALYAMNSSHNAHRPAETVWGRATEILRNLVTENGIYQHICNALGLPLPVVSWDAASQLDLARGALEHEGGDLALVAHILLPHYPFFFDANCSRSLEHARQALASRRDYDLAYSDQVRCALKQAGQLIDIADRRWPGALIIVHGDHGLRELLQFEGPNDIRLNYATLFAIRRPGLPPRLVSERENLQGLFALYAGGVSLPDSHNIYVNGAAKSLDAFPR